MGCFFVVGNCNMYVIAVILTKFGPSVCIGGAQGVVVFFIQLCWWMSSIGANHAMICFVWWCSMVRVGGKEKKEQYIRIISQQQPHSGSKW